MDGSLVYDIATLESTVDICGACIFPQLSEIRDYFDEVFCLDLLPWNLNVRKDGNQANFPLLTTAIQSFGAFSIIINVPIIPEKKTNMGWWSSLNIDSNKIRWFFKINKLNKLWGNCNKD